MVGLPGSVGIIFAPMAQEAARESPPVIDLVEGIVERGAEIQANRTFARLRALFNWAIEKDRLLASPLARMEAPTKERTRDRVLSDYEISRFWQACRRAAVQASFF
jgi:integrase